MVRPRLQLVGGLMLASLAFCAATSGPAIPDYEGFIRVQNNRFVDANCRDFPLSGMNT